MTRRHIANAWQLRDWPAYRDVQRIGRKTRLPEAQREVIWAIFETFKSEIAKAQLTTPAAVFTDLAALYSSGRTSPYEFIVVDEAQDLSVAQLRFLAALGGGRPNSPFFSGDLGQRIFQQPFSWESLGVDLRGRSRTLHVNYRTSHQIRSRADRLLGPEVSDVDGNEEKRTGTISLFNGTDPEILELASPQDEIAAVGAWISQRIAGAIKPGEIAVFVRSQAELARAQAAVEQAEQSFKLLDERVQPGADAVSMSTMHLAKGLEFRAVAVMACDDEVIPLQERVETVGDEADLQEVYDTERHLLYVACTRAPDFLLVTSGNEPSEFLRDFAVEA